MKLLIVLYSPEYLRFYAETLQLLAERGHELSVVAVKRERVDGVRLQDLANSTERIVSLGRLPKRKDVWRPVANGIRGMQDFVRYLDPVYSDSPALRARVKRKVLPRLLHWLDWIDSASRKSVRRGQRILAALEQAVPVDERMVALVRKTAPDAVLVSALVEPGSLLVEVVKCAQRVGIPTAALIASWDNLTNKGVLKIQPDRVIVWNGIQRREAERFHEMDPAKVVLTGAQPFDRWFERQPSRSRAQLCAEAGLIGDRPYLLFVGSSAFITRPGEDIVMVRKWLEALRSSDRTDLREIPVVFRPHPYNCAHWSDVDLSSYGDVAIWPRTYGKITAASNRTDYFDTLYHSGVVVGINTSAMIEAAILGKPVHSISVDEFAGTQEGTLHFRYLLPEHGGFLWLANSLQEHIGHLGVTVTGDYDRERTARFVASFLRPHGIDTPCTPILADAIEQVGRLDVPARGTGRTAALVRLALWPIAVASKWADTRRKGKPLVRSRKSPS